MKNQLSAFMDGELSVEESAHLITSAKTGGELKNCWAHYHLIGDALRGDVGLGGVNMQYDFSSGIPNIDYVQSFSNSIAYYYKSYIENYYFDN